MGAQICRVNKCTLQFVHPEDISLTSAVISTIYCQFC